MTYSGATSSYSDGDKEITDLVNECVSHWDEYWADNVRSFKNSMKRNFEGPMSDSTKNNLKNDDIFPFECNTLEPYISRLLGDFSFSDMGVEVSASDTDPTSQIPSLMTAIFKQIYYKSDSDTVQTQLYRQVLGGGYGVMRARTEYVDELSFSTQPRIEHAPDPTLCGFDPTAVLVHKGDGDYCFEFVPYTKDYFEDKFNVDPTRISFPAIGNAGTEFAWRKNNGRDDVYYVCDFYCKKRKQARIYRTPKGNLTAAQWNKLREASIGTGSPEVFVDIKTFPSRSTQFEKIYRYQVCGDKLLSESVTDLDKLPLVFFDGNSVTIQGKQKIRSFTHNVQQAQEVKDILWSKATDLLMKQGESKLIIAEEAMPTSEASKLPWKNPQKSYSMYVYKAYREEKGQFMPVPPPNIMPPEPISQELLAAKSEADQLIQLGLGSFDAQQGNIGQQVVSGKAILAGAAQSNSAAKPYLINFSSCFRQVIDILVDLIPQCYKELAQFDVKDSTGVDGVVTLNGPTGLQASDLEPNKLNVYVSLNGSFEAQRANAMQQLTQLSTTNAGLAQLLSGQGLPLLLQNLDIVGKSELIAMAEQQIQQSQNQPPQPNPAMIAAQAKIMQQQTNARKVNNDYMIDQGNLMIRQQEANQDGYKIHGKVQTELANTNINAAETMHEAAAKIEHHNLEVEKLYTPTPDAKIDLETAMMENDDGR